MTDTNNQPSDRHRSGSAAPDPSDDAIGSALWQLTRFVVVWAWRLPVVTLSVAAVAVTGWRCGPTNAIIATVVVLAVLACWAVLDPASLRRITLDRIRFRYRVWSRYRHWTALCADCGLGRVRGEDIVVPKLLRIRFDDACDVLTIKPVRGQTLSDFIAATDALADAFGADTVSATRPGPQQIRLTVQRQQPLADPVTPAATDGTSGSSRAASTLSGHGRSQRAGVRITVGERGDGRPWQLSVAGAHILIGGVTGAGKGSVLWSIIAGLAPAVAAGQVQLRVADPKGGMELALGAPLFHRFTYRADTIATMLADTTAVMTDRAERLRGTTRQHVPTRAEPLIVVVIDELAALTAYTDRKLKTEIEQHLGLLLTQGRAVGVSVVAAVQDPSKDVVPLRQLFPIRIALRMAESTQTTMILGPGAVERGARAHQIPEHLPGMGYLAIDGTAAPTLVRAFHYTDTAIAHTVDLYAPTQATDDVGDGGTTEQE
ncbi:FtsK/SpoIIIE domain-containing protein [Antrihabitans cavernicola]|uniref:FtsK domain-containing protein n=1 Tax=Antrihabitans cavernicola TaxID=2495913 RepID=A0A5A7S4T9_9NOCA|nr:FtsK/SpoIIIE domain-containing protein [Spelaeibacter cavernicola]KAA0016070.1 hypothetical protein FOY51_26715 [Spelaeibacter cavernicola]